MKKYGVKYILVAILSLSVLISFVVIYRNFNPSDYPFFPKCPSKLLTGFDCPGCGSQRAVHHLLNLELGEAAKDNLLVVLFAPYIVAGLVFENIKRPSRRFLVWRRRLFGLPAIYVIFAVITVFTVVRNVI